MAVTPGVPADRTTAEIAEDVDDVVAVRGRTQGEIVRARLRRDPVTLVAATLAIQFVLVALVAPVLTRLGVIDPYTNHRELVDTPGSLPSGPWGGVSWEHWLGVEPGTGRDLLARIAGGITISLTVAVLATTFAAVTGTVVGLVSGYSRGALDRVLGRLNDLILSFPQTLMLLSLSTIVTTWFAELMGVDSTEDSARIAYMAFVLGIFGFPFFARIIRGQVLSLREREFVEAAMSLGARRGRIYFTELLPHLWAPLLVYLSLALPANISAEAALSFLGVGVHAPTPSFGATLNDTKDYAQTDLADFAFPGLILFLLVLSFNLLGDGLRDALDPKAGRG